MKNILRIGILTFHKAINYGAVLQAFALQQVIANSGVNCEIINYDCAVLRKKYKSFYLKRLTPRGILSALVHWPFRYIRNSKFKRFRRKYLVTSSEMYLKEDLNRLQSRYDRFVVGSDQIWNIDITGSDLTYFLDFCLDNRRKYSYAASLGTAEPDQNQQTIYLKYLSDFKAIAVREESSSVFLSNLLSRPVKWTADPVFLLELDKWKRLIPEPKITEDYIFVYSLHEEDVYKYANYLKKETGLKLVCIPANFKCRIKGRKDYCAGVEDFLNYIFFSKYVISDSFHVVAFSIMFQKNVNVVLKKEYPALNSRLTSLMNFLNLKNKIICDNNYAVSLIEQIDYSQVDKILNKHVQDSIDYIREEICGEKTSENW